MESPHRFWKDYTIDFYRKQRTFAEKHRTGSVSSSPVSLLHCFLYDIPNELLIPVVKMDSQSIRHRALARRELEIPVSVVLQNRTALGIGDIMTKKPQLY